ncbi:MAG: hypothetical protein IJJ14_00590, partial [Coriobacteriales bacterium]|nr:hypothetical protein [Coriobacteriales bacterium]
MPDDTTKGLRRFDKHWFYIACVGLGLYFAYSEAYRYTALVYLPPSTLSSTLASLFTLLLAGGALLAFCLKKELGLARNKAFIVIMIEGD